MANSLIQLVRRAITGETPLRTFDDVEAIERAIGMQHIHYQVRDQVDALDVPEEGIYYYLADIFFDAGVLYAIIVSQGRLYRADIRIGNDDSVTLGSLLQVTQMFVPAVSRTGFQQTRVLRTATGRYRWISISNTAVLNRVGQLDSRDLFDTFVEHAQRTGQYPYRTFVHSGEVLRTGQADFLARDGYCYITSGLYDEDNALAEIERVALENNPARWGESIGFVPTEEPEIIDVGGVNIPVFRAGVNYEISTCREADAAAWFTSANLVTREVLHMDATVRSSLQELMADANIDDATATSLLEGFETMVDSVNERAQKPGTIARANTGTEEDANGGDPPETDNRELVIDESVIEAIVNRVIEDERFVEATAVQRSTDDVPPDLSALSERVDGLVQRMDEAEGVINGNFANLMAQVTEATAALETEVERASAMPPMGRTTVVYRPSNPSAVGGDEYEESGEPGGLKNIPAYKGAHQ